MRSKKKNLKPNFGFRESVIILDIFPHFLIQKGYYFWQLFQMRPMDHEIVQSNAKIFEMQQLSDECSLVAIGKLILGFESQRKLIHCL